MKPVHIVSVAAMLASTAVTAQPQCRAFSSATPPTVVELYTSEGCSSCPPADRWASTLKGRADVLVLGFHVNYWDRLGWRDRFASAETTERQRLVQRAAGSAYVYTPQVLLNGRDWRGWSGSTFANLPSSPIVVTLEREGNVVRAQVEAPAGGALAGFWAVVEDGHASRVRAGENAGETLKHDHVVTLYRPVARLGKSQALELPAQSDGAARRVAFVVTDADGLKPLQVALLSCGS